MKLSKLSCAIVLGQLSMGAAVAHAAAAPTLGDVLGASGITASGYVDGAYTHFDTDAGSASANYFDSASPSTFTLKQASVTIAKQPTEGFGALLNVTTGTDAKSIHSAGASADDFDVTQGFVQYTSGALTVIGGKFNTLAGAEVIAPTGNTNISRSVAFLNALPFTHTGVRLSYAVASNLTVYLGSNNGWDQLQDSNKGKTTELGVSFAPSDLISGAIYGYTGGEGSPSQKQTLVDVVVTIKPIKPLAFVINYDQGSRDGASAVVAGDKAKWTAINLYTNYQFTDKLRGSLRLEQFDDKGGLKLGTVGGMAQKVKSYTATVGYAMADNFELRGELRQDKSNQKGYTKDSAATDKQQYFAVEGLYKF